jgi:SAM-dependent methyltransferase
MNSELISAYRAAYEAYPFAGYMDTVWPANQNVGLTVIRHLPRGSRILDFGAGGLDKTAMLSGLGYKMYAYDDFGDEWHGIGDNRQRLLAFAERFEIEFHAVLDFAPHSLDMVMLHDVLEHFDDSPRELLNTLLGFVRPGGYLFVTVPNAANIRKRISALLGRTTHPPYDMYFWCPGEWRGHVREYVRDDLRRLGANLGLSNAEIFSAHHMIDRKVPKIAHPLYRGVTALFPGWRDTWCLVAKKPAGWTPSMMAVDQYRRLIQPQNVYRYD